MSKLKIPMVEFNRAQRWFRKAELEILAAKEPIAVLICPGLTADAPNDLFTVALATFDREHVAELSRSAVDHRGMAMLCGRYVESNEFKAQLYFADGSVFVLARLSDGLQQLHVTESDTLPSPLRLAVIV